MSVTNNLIYWHQAQTFGSGQLICLKYQENILLQLHFEFGKAKKFANKHEFVYVILQPYLFACTNKAPAANCETFIITMKMFFSNETYPINKKIMAKEIIWTRFPTLSVWYLRMRCFCK